MRAPLDRPADLEHGMEFAGGPEQVAMRILDRINALDIPEIMQMDVGRMPHENVLRCIELLAKEVLPRVRQGITKSSLS